MASLTQAVVTLLIAVSGIALCAPFSMHWQPFWSDAYHLNMKTITGKLPHALLA
jgi:hypothetical protein